MTVWHNEHAAIGLDSTQPRASHISQLDLNRLPPPTLCARYEQLERIAEGSMGTVYRGWDPRLGRAVAIKLLKSDAPADTRRFLQEAKAQARVRHENICQVYEAGEVDGEPFIAMEFIAGQSLDHAHHGMHLEQKVRVIREVAAALHEAHRAGMIHRDVKPGNIMIARNDDGSYKPYVVDFGLARDVSKTGASTQNGIVGTPAYMSPEQAAGSSAFLDRRTDVYSLGATLYDIVAGRTPFVGANALELLTHVLYDDPPALGKVCRGIPKRLETIVMTCIRREPERRYESARALGEDLQRFLDGVAIQAKPPPIGYVIWRKARRHRAVVVVTALGLCTALVLAGMWVRSLQQASRQAEFARELGEDVKYVELFLRSAYAFPTHDIERDEKVVRARIAGIERRMASAGSIGEGPGHYALGRAQLALHDYRAAQEHLEHALLAKYSRSEVHYALGLTLGARYQIELDEARRIDDAAARTQAIKKAELTFREPAVEHLRQTGETEIESKAYIDGLVALYEKRYDDAIKKAIAAYEESPWLYEARRLEGDARFELGMAAVESGDQAKARQLFTQATAAYGTAAEMARSDAALHEALAEAWIQILALNVWTDQPYQEAFEAARTACVNAMKANPRIASPATRQARAYVHVGHHQARMGQDPRRTLQLAIDSGLAATALAPHDAISIDSVGNALIGVAIYEKKLGLDLRPTLERALHYFDESTRLQPAFAWAWNDAGVALMVRSEYENARGLDPLVSIAAAISRFERAIRENNSYTMAMANLIYVLTIRANHELAHGVDPHPTVQQAVAHAERGYQIDPQWLPLLNNRGWAELVAAQYEENMGADPSRTLENVEKTFQSSLDLNKDEADTHFGMGSAKHVRALHQIRRSLDPQKVFDEARTCLQRATELDAQEPNIRLELGQLYLTMARHALEGKRDPTLLFENAEKVFREGLRINNRHARLHAALAEVLGMRAEHLPRKDAEQKKLMTDGFSSVDEALVHNPKSALALATKASLYAIRANMNQDTPRAEDQRLARAWFDKALIINDRLPPRFKQRIDALGQSETIPPVENKL